MEIRSFKAFRFDPEVVGDVGRCIAPPYDVISPDHQEALYAQSDYNIVRVIKGKTSPSDNGDQNQYTRAAEHLNRWIEDGALKQDDEEAMYGYVQDFVLGTETLQRVSFIALAKIEEFGKTVKPHEQVFKGPMIDRLQLKRATRARFGLVFMLYDNEQHVAEAIVRKAMAGPALLDATDEQGVRHRLFALTDKADINGLVEMMNDKSCIIADGHHRYTTGLAFAKESPDSRAKYQMMAFTNSLQAGLVVLATHRSVGSLADFDRPQFVDGLSRDFEVTTLASESDEQKAAAKNETLSWMHAAQAEGKHAFGVYCEDGSFHVAVLRDERLMAEAAPQMSPAWRTLDVSILEKLILERVVGLSQEQIGSGEYVGYVKDSAGAVEEAMSAVDSGKKQLLLLTNPVKMEQLRDVTDAGERMPRKSTYFFPKLYTGLTIQKM